MNRIEVEKKEFEDETARLQTILSAHQSHIDTVRAQAELLAAQAAESTADGIRDLVDEDAEVDAAVQASLVRQASDRAMHAVRRLRQLEDLGSALAFGHTTDLSGDRQYVGRHSVIEGDEVLLVDWRADVAMPFYRATYGEPLGVVRRRHLLYDQTVSTQEQTLIDFSDEILSETPGNSLGVRGEAALLVSLEAPTSDRMRSVVATIQAEQDAIVRAPSDVPLVVQGGPGTGKTVVALHRAAYLLYNYRLDLEDSGVLIVGPSKEFLSYIAQVLPSLGETGVVSSTVDRLYPGVRLGFVESSEAAACKGELFMATVLQHALVDRQRFPVDDLSIWYGSTCVRVVAEELQHIFLKAKRYQHHNQGARGFRKMVVEAFVRKAYSPSFDLLDDVRASFGSAVEMKEFLLKHWPPLTAEQMVNDLFGSRALLRSALRKSNISAEYVDVLHRPRSSESNLADRRWSSADVALLDEVAFLVDGLVGESELEQMQNRDALSEFELAALEENEHEVDLSAYVVESEVVDPLEPSGYWRLSDKELGLFPIMYDQAEEDHTRKKRSE